MEVYQISSPEEITARGLYLAMGTFDGVHLGHKKVIEKTIERARKLGIPAGIFTFWPHPISVLNPSRAPTLLTSLEDKLYYIGALGADLCLVQQFTPEFGHLDYRRFINDYLVEKLDIRGLVVGAKFRFGARGEGDREKIKKAGADFGFEPIVLEPVTIDGFSVSSTLIRRLIKAGRVNEVPAFLGRPYGIKGRVEKGEGRGSSLGFPTANLDFPSGLTVPLQGVYTVWARVQGKQYPGVLNLGACPTFGKECEGVEVHLLGLNDQIYGEEISVWFHKYLRPIKQFPNPEDLRQQISRDIETTRQTLKL